LLLIVVLNYFYEYLAEYLTELEFVRTQTEFDDSITLKIYLLQFVNYYASIFYLAFFKGKFIGSPKEYNRFFDFRQEECGLGGCMMELMIQLAIIMIGKQAMNAFIENLFPIVQKRINKTRLKMGKKRDRSLKGKERYIQDLKLVEFGTRGLFPEYLEMIIQYGFVTIFVAAFPLAPFFALINNIIEVRLDAKKLLAYYRRPIFSRVKNIGVWYRILDCISKLSVITNGFIIAFTSDFVPRLVYYYYYSNQTLDGYVEFTLSTFNTSEFKSGTAPLTSQMQNVTECRYQDYRYPSNHTLEYKRTAVFWNVMAARLIFVVIFENAVAIVMILVRWLIPNISADLKDQIRREAYITNEIIIKQEALRASRDASKNPHVGSNSAWNRLISNNLSGSQLDLFIHSENETRTRKRLKKDKTQEFIDSETQDSENNNKKSGDETNV
jgi:anoctamin-1